MQALRRAVVQGLRMPAAAAQQARGFASAEVKQIGQHDSAIKKEQVGLWIMLATCVAFIARDTMYPEEDYEGVLPPYPYLRIRTKEKFPWGSEDGCLEFHRVVGKKPEAA
jgi:hypothetical protein